MAKALGPRPFAQISCDGYTMLMSPNEDEKAVRSLDCLQYDLDTDTPR